MMAYKPLPPAFTLKVDSNPKGAAIYLDGQFRGNTPSTISGLKGRYTLKLSLAGYQDYVATLDIAGRTDVSRRLAPLRAR